MKKLIIISFLFITIVSRAQTFQGTITWSLKTDITDPVEKAKLEDAQKKMSDPANKVKMKKMQEQMNTPEMKASMDANPQMKARIESALALMQVGNTSIANINFIMKTDGLNSLTKTEGVFPVEMLYLFNKAQTYTINRAAKTYSVLPATSDASHRNDSIQRKVTKTSETMKIMGHTCTKTIVALTTKGGITMSQFFWTTTEIKGYDMKTIAQKIGNTHQPFYADGITGAPLRIEMITEKAKTVMEVTDIKQESIPASEFTIPADFKETKGVF
ncbi:MAG: DUF4412 domain-containing protein [Chitinophagaceae bacterium]